MSKSVQQFPVDGMNEGRCAAAVLAWNHKWVWSSVQCACGWAAEVPGARYTGGIGALGVQGPVSLLAASYALADAYAVLSDHLTGDEADRVCGVGFLLHMTGDLTSVYKTFNDPRFLRST